MEIIHFTTDDLGSLDWELPKDVAEKLAAMEPGRRHEIQDQLTVLTQTHIYILRGVLKLRDPDVGLAYCFAHNEALTEALLELPKT